MKGVQCYELFGGIALKNHAFSFFSIDVNLLSMGGIDIFDIWNSTPSTFKEVTKIAPCLTAI